MKKLSEITRTEVFFTTFLYHAFVEDQKNFESYLLDKIGVIGKTRIVDSGCEVCLFRDMAKSGYIKIREDRKFEKQTFDNVFILSNNSIVLLEAKSHQQFNTNQISDLEQARKKIENGELPWDKVYLVGLCSSRYTPKEDTKRRFNAVITWSEVASLFIKHRDIFERADKIYNDKVNLS